MAEVPRLRFIPFRRADVVQMCRAEIGLGASMSQAFETTREKIETHFQNTFHLLRHELKHAYAPVDPDADTRMVETFRSDPAVERLGAIIEEVLDRANYDKVSREQLLRAFKSASLFQLKLHVDLDEFEEALLFTRGASEREEEVKTLFGLRRRQVKFINYERVVLFIRFRKDVDARATLGGCQPGSTMLKLFQNVPGADMEMLFPNTRVGMRLIDKMMIAVPALVSGGIVMTTKLGATLVLLGSLFGFWLGLHADPVTLDKAAILVLLAGLGTLGGFFWKQYSSFRNRKLRFTQALTENLYFKLLDNNAGVLFRILDEAEDSECKEALLAYSFLLKSTVPLTASELDEEIEQWFEQQWQCRFDFDIDDALNKLALLELATEQNGRWCLPAVKA